MDNKDEDTYYQTQLTNTVYTRLGNKHEITINSTVTRAYSALYMRIVMSVVQLLALLIGVTVGYLAAEQGSRELLTCASETTVILWIAGLVTRSKSVVNTRAIDSPLIACVMVFAILSMLPFGHLFSVISGVIGFLFIVAIPINNISWDLFLINMVEQKEQYDQLQRARKEAKKESEK